MLLLIDIFSINKGRGYENPSLEIIVTEHCLTEGFPIERPVNIAFSIKVLFLLLFLYHFYVIVEIMLVILLLFFHF
jgi:hypothetical protein